MILEVGISEGRREELNLYLDIVEKEAFKLESQRRGAAVESRLLLLLLLLYIKMEKKKKKNLLWLLLWNDASGKTASCTKEIKGADQSVEANGWEKAGYGRIRDQAVG